MAAAQRPTMVELEDKLAKDKDKKELNRLLAELDGYLAQSKKALDAGLPPKEFRAMSKYRNALEQARDVASKAWLMLCKV
jgi:hypothetical protein